MLSAVYRLRPHIIRTNPFRPRCLHLSIQKNANTSLGLILHGYLARARHTSNVAAGHITMDARVPHGAGSTPYKSSSTSSTESPTDSCSIPTPLDPSSYSQENQTSLPIQRKSDRLRKDTQLGEERASQAKTEKTQRKTRTIEHEEPKTKPKLIAKSKPPKEPPKEPKPSEEPKVPKENMKEPKPPKEPKPSKAPKEPKVLEENKPPKKAKTPKQPSPPKELRPPNELKASKDLEPPKEPRTPKASKEPKVSEEPKPSKKPKLSEESKAPKNPKPPKEPTKAKELKSPKQSKKAKEPKPPKPRPKIANLPPNQIEDFLDRIAEEDDALTIEEVERYKPAIRPSELSPKYESSYEDLMSTLLRSFRVEQFEEIAALYGLKPAPGSSRTKKEYAALLMENAWGWTSLTQVQEEKRDREERVDTNIQLKPLELSLLLGQDGSRLQEVAARYDVKLQVNQGQTSLRLIGRLGHAKRFQGYLDNFRQDIVTEEIILPPGSHVDTIDENTLEAILRITGAFIEKESGKLCASFLKNHRQSAEKARLLVAQVLSEKRIIALPGALLSGSSSLYTNRDAPISYSLFPFAAHRTPSWKDPNRGTFRLRRIGHWLDTIHPRDGMGLEDVLRHTSSIVLGHSDPTGLYESLMAPFSLENEPSDILISATCGYILFSTPPSQRHSLRPPLQGQLTINNILDQSKATPTHQKKFHPCAPSVLESQAPQREERIQKLIYIADQPDTMKQLNETLIFEITTEQDAPEINTKTCYLQKEFVIELSMPDRPLDVQIFATSRENIDYSDWSDQFDFMNNTTDEISRMPLTLTLRDRTYTLLSHLSIHREHHQIGSQLRKAVTVDKIVDNHTGLTSSFAKITCEDHQSESGRTAFLRGCDRLTSVE